MTRGQEDAPRSPACPDDEQLAAYVDNRLDPSARLRTEAHLADCSRCRTVLRDTQAFLNREAQRFPKRRSQLGWPTAAIAGLATAAAVLLYLGTGMVWFSRRAPTEPAARPELAGLVAAAAHEPTRLAEGRLSGGFVYKPAPVQTRGATAGISPEVKIAAARIEQSVRGQNTPAAEAALGASYLAVGDLDRAVERLEAAVDQSPGDPHFQNDLSVAYIARATRSGRADDWPKAFAAAERAAKSDPKLVEPCFNRALALEGLTLATEAAEAWDECARASTGSEWANEAQARAEAIRSRLRAPRPQSKQQQREHIEDQLLVQWAEAEIDGDRLRADSILATAEREAQMLADGGDTMPIDEVALIRRSTPASHERVALAKAHLAYGRARDLFLRDRLSEASAEMSAAAKSFAIAGSWYVHWAAVYRAIPLWIAGLWEQSLRTLSSIPMGRIPSGYAHLRGRVAWTRAMAFETVGQFDQARDALEEARALFQGADELEYESANASYLADTNWYLGSRQQMWVNQLQALEHVHSWPPSVRRNVVFTVSGMMALSEELPETALAFQQHLFGLLNAEITAGLEDPNAYLRRSQIFAKLGDTPAALGDLAHAQAAASSLADARLRDWMLAEVNTARAEALIAIDPAAAVEAADTALAFFRPANSAVKVSALLLARARAREVSGEFSLASSDYEASIAALEQNQDRIREPQERKAAFDQQRAAVREAVRFAAVTRRDPAEALWIAERARARLLRERLGGDRMRPLNPTEAHHLLPRDVAVIYFVALPDRVLGWMFTTGAVTPFAVTVDAKRLARIVRRLHQRIADNATNAELGAEWEVLKPLVEPALSVIPRGATLVLVPDEGLATIPFAALPDADGAPLVAAHPILFAPSFTTLMLASERLADFEPDGVLAVGDGHDPVVTSVPLLRWADSEASAVARLYPRAELITGSNATIRNFLSARRSVLHFAGHTIANPDFPFLSRLLFAPDPDDHESTGVLLASAIAAHAFSGTRVVILASCESAAGRFIRGEGFDSVARMFLEAGVPSIVASLWPVDDDQTTLFLELHRQLRTTRNPIQALRAAQLQSIRGGSAAIRRWAGLVAVGGSQSVVQKGRVE